MEKLHKLLKQVGRPLACVFAMAAVAIMLVPVGANAGTADGASPANEGVCDPLVGGTPGLYGLCVAYCEAQDLDGNPGKPSANNILDVYNKRRKAGES